jgi:hypothetical protein
MYNNQETQDPYIRLQMMLELIELRLWVLQAIDRYETEHKEHNKEIPQHEQD